VRFKCCLCGSSPLQQRNIVHASSCRSTSRHMEAGNRTAHTKGSSLQTGSTTRIVPPLLTLRRPKHSWGSRVWASAAVRPGRQLELAGCIALKYCATFSANTASCCSAACGNGRGNFSFSWFIARPHGVVMVCRVLGDGRRMLLRQRRVDGDAIARYRRHGQLQMAPAAAAPLTRCDYLRKCDVAAVRTDVHERLQQPATFPFSFRTLCVMPGTLCSSPCSGTHLRFCAAAAVCADVRELLQHRVSGRQLRLFELQRRHAAPQLLYLLLLLRNFALHAGLCRIQALSLTQALGGQTCGGPSD